MNWRDMAGDKLMSPKEAVSVIRPSDKVMSAPINVTPFTLCRALFERRHELKGLHLDHFAPFFSWKAPSEELMFELHDLYATGVDREMVNSGEVHYSPNARRVCCRNPTFSWWRYRLRTTAGIAVSAPASSSRAASARSPRP